MRGNLTTTVVSPHGENLYTSLSSSPSLPHKTTAHSQPNAYRQSSEPISCCNPALIMWGLCEPRCHGNWTPHSGPWREDTEPYLSTFTSQSVTWPALSAAAGATEQQQTERLSCTLQEVSWVKNPHLFICTIKRYGANKELTCSLHPSNSLKTGHSANILVTSQLLQ